MEKNYRLFIRNLPSDITNDKLHDIFNKYGTITNIDIKEKLQNDGTKIAFINFTTTERQLNTCSQEVNSIVLGNNKISVQLAKESFLDRLKREREETASKNEVKQSPVFTDRPIDPINIKVPVPFVNNNVKKTFSDDLIESIKNSPLEIVKKAPYSQSIKYNSQNFEEKNENRDVQSKEKKVLSDSEMKRLASLKKQKQMFRAKEQMVRDALKAVDSNRKNKIIFNDNIGDDSSQNASATKLSLFNNDNDDDDEANWNSNFDVTRKPKVKTIGGDERFKMDERFFDNDDTKSDENEPVEDELTNERKMQLEILNDVLGRPIAKNRENSTSEKRKNQMVRYDPNKDDHRHYEVENEKNTPVSKKKRKKNNETVVEELPPIPVSNEMFYSVSDTLTESLKPQENFSLLQTFGAAVPSADDKNDNYEIQEISKNERRLNFNFDTKNPFKYDSSDDEDENSPNQEYSEEKPNNKLSDKNIIALDRCDSFFFIPNDPRFKEAEEFFDTKSDHNESFDNVRRELKQIVRSKVRNNARKNQPWRKKLGTKSRLK